MKLTRRDFLKYSGFTGTAILGGYMFNQISNPIESGGQFGTVNPDFNADVDILFRAHTDTVQILDGPTTTVWRYTGEIILGSDTNLQTVSDSYLGPSIRVRTGQKVRISFENNLPEASNIHWHGLYVPDYADGHPRFVAQAGETYVYEFEVINRAGTYWYHPHPHQRTGVQVNAGLAGLFIVEDDTEDSLNIPSGQFDLPLVIQDRRFDAANQLIYVSNMHDRMMGFRGNTVLVNGEVNARWSVATRSYRLRLLNGSNSRIYILAWNDESPLYVIGTDGGLLERTVTKQYITLGPAERVELWVDFSNHEIGTELQLIDLGAEQAIILGTFSVEQNLDERVDIPTTIREMEYLDSQQAVNTDHPRNFDFTMGQTSPMINNQTFEMNAVADNELVRLGDTEIWEFRNHPQNGMMSMPHPIHMHGRQFQVIERTVLPNYARQWANIIEGYVDYGWKDTVLLLPGETVRVIVKFDHYPGIFVYHCHTLEHEDLGMMRNYEVLA
ncbi:MAG: multicopper oxidase domain-containing protein [Phototrophicaceae bacterium]